VPVSIRPFLMFQNHDAEAAMNFYVALFGGKVDEITRYGAGESGAEGSVKRARFTITDQTVLCIDSPIKHAFGFTPAVSLFVECRSEDEIRRVSSALSEGGGVLMALGNYGFSRLFAWVNDRYGVSWQLNFV
jgi:predicted 3-demethylubiquinone-9 3-methyltransferase (glyoxalase superfamily)